MSITAGLLTDPAITSIDLRDNTLVGSMPSIAGNTSIQSFHIGNNQLTGLIPSLVTNTSLMHFYCNANQLTGVVPDFGVADTAMYFIAGSNSFTEEVVNTILLAFDRDVVTAQYGIISLTGDGVAAPTWVGLTAKASLEAKNWTVFTN